MTRRLFPLAFLAGTFLLASCGGGGSGGGGGPRIGSETNAIQQITGSTPPTETVTDQLARSPAILSRSDSLVLSNQYVKVDSGVYAGQRFIISSSCQRDTCILSNSQLGVYQPISISTLSDNFITDQSDAVATKWGITLARLTEGGNIDGVNVDARSFGSWMLDSGFSVAEAPFSGPGGSGSQQNAIAGGDLTGYRPNGNATWRGLMVGTPVAGSNIGNLLQGDAILTYSFNNSQMNAAFTNIKDIDLLQPHSVSTVRFNNIPVNEQGEFGIGITGNKISGGFYGSNHTEAAGVFEQSNIVGAFGAKKE